MKRVLIPILLVALLLVGCYSNEAKVEELQSEIAELEERLAEAEAQIAEREARQDKSKAIVEFADQALELRSAFMDISYRWLAWYHQNLPDPDNYPRYTTRNKEIEAINEAQKLFFEVKGIVTSIEQLYAPPEAIETKRKLLTEGDSLQQAFNDICNYYAAPDTHPPSLYEEGLNFISHELGEIDKDVRRELVDLGLEYGQ